MGAVVDTLAARISSQGYAPGTDPRTKPELAQVLREVSFDERNPGPPEIDKTDFDAVLARVAEQWEMFEGVYESMPNELPGDEDVAVDCTTRTVTAKDGFEIELRIHRPAGVTGLLPGGIYYHGGGMVILSAFNKVHQRWCHDLAASGMVAIAVDYRNAYGGEEGVRPFPTGLEDCFTALRWVDEHRDELGISSLILLGESGGANLSIATTLMAKREGELDRVDGVYGTVPYLSGGYGWDVDRKKRELPSLVELDGYLISCADMELLGMVYDPGGENAENPLCWPYHASVEDLNGLPPHVIAVNELDPLCDEGSAFLRKLQQAGVPTVGRTNVGLTHAAELIYRQALPMDYFATIGDIRRFAASLR
jgi:acetyl esterase/lipase